MTLLRPYGEHAVLADVGSTERALAVHAALRDAPGVLETVPAARTVLVVFDPDRTDAATVGALVEQAPERAPTDASAVVLDVRYDGADLDDTAAELGITTDDLVALHSGAAYVVGFCGFSPGFAYLTGLPPALHVGRLASPRTAVPAGSVAIAGEYAGVYPRSSPGGWRLLGTTAAPVWDADRDPPALLVPGTAVRFRPT